MYVYKMSNGKYIGKYSTDLELILPRGVYELTDRNGNRVKLLKVK